MSQKVAIKNRTGVYKYTHKDGEVTYYIAYRTTKKNDGKMVWKKVGKKSEGVTAAYAQEVRSEYIRQARFGDLLVERQKQSQMTFDQAFEKFKDIQVGNGVVSIAEDIIRYKKHLKGPFGGKLLADITAAEIELEKKNWVIARRDKNRNRVIHALKPATKNQIISIITRVYNKMIKKGLYVGPNPAINVDKFKLQNHRHRFLSHEEFKLLIDDLKTRCVMAMQFVAIGTLAGLRKSEIVRLEGQHINMRRRQIKVEKESGLHNNKGDTRYVPICDTLFDILKGLVLEPNKKLFDHFPQGHIARAMQDTGLNKNVKRGDPLAKATFHTTRHTFCSWLVIGGASLERVGKLAGHKNPNTTKRYAHLNQADDETIINAMDKALKKDAIKTETIHV